MMWLFRAGSAAACRQLVTVCSIILIALVVSSDNKLPARGYFDVGNDSGATQLFKWTFLLIALGLAGTNSRAVNQSAERLRYVFRSVRLPPRLTSTALLFQLVLATMALGVLMLGNPPEPVIKLGAYIGFGSTAAIVWDGLLSIGIAYFGACTHALLKVGSRRPDD